VQKMRRTKKKEARAQNRAEEGQKQRRYLLDQKKNSRKKEAWRGR